MHSFHTPRKHIEYALIILPALALGVLAMLTGGVSPMLWGQQIAAFLLFAPLGLLLRRAADKLPRAVWASALILLPAAALLFPGVGGARRWLDLGPVSANAAMLVLPSLLVLMDGMRRPYPAMLAAAAVLCLQPDLSQLSAFALGTLPLLHRERKKQLLPAVVLLLLAALVLRCAMVPTAIEPVDYCEGVIAMLGTLSPLLMAAGWAALALIPGSFLYRLRRDGGVAALCLSLYYAAIILFSLGGAYPVPFMGFGMSPIAGYLLAPAFWPAQAEKQ